MANAFLLSPLAIVGASSPTSSTVAGAFLNVANDYAGVIWRSNIGIYGVPSIDLDLGADFVFDTVMIFGITGMGAAASATVTVVPDSGGNFASNTQASGSQALYAGTVMPVSGFGVAILDAPSGVTGRNRRVRLIFNSGAGDFIQISRIVVGKKIQLGRNFGFGATFGVRDLGSLDFSARGVLLRRRAKKLRTVALTFSNIRKDEVEATTKPLLEQIGNTEMVALVTDPSVDAQRQNRCYYGPLVGDLSQAWRNAAAFEAKVNLVSIF
uniref:hypothetical protein n=1 Tax=uncultured Sphingomonas sp. TaxID=158754 RepID=UPI0035C9BE87